jgi:hypothetical protein
MLLRTARSRVLRRLALDLPVMAVREIMPYFFGMGADRADGSLQISDVHPERAAPEVAVRSIIDVDRADLGPGFSSASHREAPFPI